MRKIRSLAPSVLVVVVVATACLTPEIAHAGNSSQPVGPAIPAGVIEIEAPEPLEISGVAAVPGGYAVVGDDTGDHGRIWPGGARWEIEPEVEGPESVDVGFGPQGEELWLVLGEDGHTLSDLSGARYTFPSAYREVCGRGLEGLAVKWTDAGWLVAALWEGGYYKRGCTESQRFSNPRVAILRWEPGIGSRGPDREFELHPPLLDDGERFRAPDLVWHGDDLLVLLGSRSKSNKTRSHTWLQMFNQNGEAFGSPFALEDRWGPYRDGKNWEALDWTLDGKRLVMGFDAKKGRRALVIFPYP